MKLRQERKSVQHDIQTHTDEVIESEEGASEFSIAFHDYPYSRADTSIDKLYIAQVIGMRCESCCGHQRYEANEPRGSI